jgi:hypothetical protein
MSVIDVGRRLAVWLAPLGVHCEEPTDGTIVLTGGGREVRWYLQESGEFFEVLTAERAEEPRLEMRTPSLVDAERFLVVVYGPLLRDKVLRQSPSLVVPWERDQLAPGFDLVEAEGPLYATLVQAGQVRAEFRSFNFPDSAVMFSQVADATVADAQSSYLDELGKPLFTVE